MLCALSESLAILDAHWQCLTNFEQRYWIFETIYDIGEQSLGLLCDPCELNPAQASVGILTGLSSDPDLAVFLYDSMDRGFSSAAYPSFFWLHVKLALTAEQAEHLFHKECLRRWGRTASQFREGYDAGYYADCSNGIPDTALIEEITLWLTEELSPLLLQEYPALSSTVEAKIKKLKDYVDEEHRRRAFRCTDNLHFLEKLRTLVEASLDEVITMTMPTARFINAERAAFAAQILCHDGTEQDDAAAREAYRTMLQTLGEA